ncbi:class III lanthionine synthetase LanKC [Actinocrispum wychmicini]|uniref:non-specific serine/threonine protein kinase n=1 Tax=Actinocrispum wychmicini TaxID=1213861 RepID=A0A4R2IQH5_9PSEU|nr:class III lanthionine synthetase LanKC [Actinocrispum wychmicini]TCO46656.1 protein kinase-like protein [Actinocrispum wychmicini]
MNEEYEGYTMADASFYDAMHSERTAGESFAAVERPLPDTWTKHEQDDWFVINPGTPGLPLQGWKIHASATQDNAAEVIETVWDYCVPRGIEFKFLRSKKALLARVSKYAPRGFSGKLVTIYPKDDTQCEQILTELGELLDGEPSPYILSDLRWGKGPLFVRYGAFASRYTVDESGELVDAIADPDGNLVMDRRAPVFHTPPWVTLPGFLEPHLAARNAVSIENVPYTFDRPIHFSNGGGIYVGTDKRTGKEVVLKEARPHSGLDAWGHDAVRRLEREHNVLRRLAGIPGIPEVYDLFWVGEHRFVAMEYIEGTVLSKAIVGRYPLIKPSQDEDDLASFTDWAVDVHRQVAETIDAVHERGIVYGDLHLFNIVVRDDGSTVLLDFEVAAPVEEAGRPGLGNQGFASRTMAGFDVDNYALACLRLALFLPMTNLLGLHRVKARHFAQIITDHFPVATEFLAKGVDVIVPPGTPALPNPQTERTHWSLLRDDLARAIVASATPQRTDRLFPGDPQQFGKAGHGLSYGAAGVLYALSVTGAGRYEQYEEWLLHQAANPPGGIRLGLYDGLHGVAFTLDHLGYRQQALDTVDICLRENWLELGPDLAGGLAGVGLNLLHLADRTGEPALRVAAHKAAGILAERPDDADDSGISGGQHPYAGLMRGRAGQALLLIRTYDDTGDVAYLDAAARALRQDLTRTYLRSNGVVEVSEGWRTMPYLATGSVGIGMVLDEYLARRHDEQFAETNQGIALAAESTMYILPGLTMGRAGILAYLVGRLPSDHPLVVKQIRNLAWHALPYKDGMAFPGTALLRLSMDLATGTAGVLLALGMALHHEPVHMPLLAPTRRTAPQTPAPTGTGS